ncbi:MAG TPA: hypothetical protein PKD70_07145 [Saprospiraceae bacterium]|nr:hypothetical protein [Saprospiraceae bacterium]HMP13638.1 hypothetical protein [Saprospiraceae bacterium]
MASEKDGLLQEEDHIIQKLNFLRKERTIASDAGVKFTLQMQIKEAEKDLEEVRAKIAKTDALENSMSIEPPNTMPIIQNDNKTRYDKFVDKLKNNRFWVIIIIAFVVIGGIGTLVELIKNTQEILPIDKDKPEIITSENSTKTTEESTKPTEPRVIKESDPTPSKPITKGEPVKKIISITLLVNAEFENAEITINGNRVYPLTESTPTFKKLNIEYNVAGYEVVFKTTNKTCTKQFSIAENELNNPITIPVSCTN